MATDGESYNADLNRNMYNFGSIFGNTKAGGIIGSANYTTLSNAYNLGSVTATDGTAGGIIGNSDHFWGDRSVITNCYYAKDTDLNENIYAFGNRTDTGVADDEVNVAEPKTLAQLQEQSTFVNWDFTDVWRMDAATNGGYPYLSWQTFDSNTVPVNGVTLDKTALTLSTGDTAYLTANVSPATAMDKTVTWASTAPEAVAVSPAGKVTALSAGTATITATAADGVHSASCTVTVNARTAKEYELTSLTVCNAAGDKLTAIPNENFWAKVAVKKLTAGGNSVVLLGAYNANGQFQNLYAAQAENVPVGGTVTLSFLIPNGEGVVAYVKAFCVASLGDLAPLSAGVQFPATLPQAKAVRSAQSGVITDAVHDVTTADGVTLVPQTAAGGPITAADTQLGGELDGVSAYANAKRFTLTFAGVEDREYTIYLAHSGDTLNVTNLKYFDQCTGAAEMSVDIYPAALERSGVYDVYVTSVGEGYRKVGSFRYSLADCTVTGVTTSWDSKEGTVYRLYPATMSDEKIKADIELAQPLLGVAATSAGMPAQSADGKTYSQSVAFDAIVTGTYKLAVYKPDSAAGTPYLTKIQTVSVDRDGLAVEEITLRLVGDVDNSGTLTAIDQQAVYSHINASKKLQEEDFLAADVNNDAMVNVLDQQIIYLHSIRAS